MGFRNHGLAFKHKQKNVVWTKGTSGLEGEFQSGSEVDFYIDKNMIHIADTKVARRYGDFFIRQIHKFDELNRGLRVLVGPCVGPPLVLGIHADHGGVLANKGLRVKTLLQGLLSQLSLLPLLQLLEVPLLLLPLLLVVVLVSLKLDHDVEQLGGLGLQVVGVHGLKVQGLDSDGEGDLLLFLEHLLPLGLGLLKALLLLLSLSGPLVSLLFPQLLLLFLLLLVELLLLLGSDLLPLGLLLLQLLQLLLFLLPGGSPF